MLFSFIKTCVYCEIAYQIVYYLVTEIDLNIALQAVVSTAEEFGYLNQLLNTHTCTVLLAIFQAIPAIC